MIQSFTPEIQAQSNSPLRRPKKNELNPFYSLVALMGWELSLFFPFTDYFLKMRYGREMMSEKSLVFFYAFAKKGRGGGRDLLRSWDEMFCTEKEGLVLV